MQGSIAQIFEIFQRLLNARQYRRLQLFATAIRPILEDMGTTHREFLRVYEELQDIVAQVARFLSDRPNDLPARLKPQLARISLVSARIRERRADRRATYEEVIARSTSIERSLSLRLTMTPTETAAMKAFFASVREYFERGPFYYNHGVRRDVAFCERVIMSVLDDPSNADAALKRMNERFQCAEAEFEDRWATIAARFAELKVALEGSVP